MRSILQLHRSDNVAVALVPLVKGTVQATDQGALEALDSIDSMHKIALVPVRAGEAIIKYGQPIGTALCDIAAGSHVHGHNCDVTFNKKDYDFCRNAQPTSLFPKQQQASFLGYRRFNQKVGTRNYIGILTTVNCSATVASQIAAYFSQPGALAAFGKVDGVVALTHSGGCGMRSSGEGYELLERTLVGYANHANFGGVIMVGLGCETMQIQRLAEDNQLQQHPAFKTLVIQEAGGTRAAIEQGIALIKDMLPRVNDVERTPTPASELTLAVQCGGSDAFSGITANPALGAAADLLVRHGGTVIYSETPEIYGAEHLLTQRAVTPEVAEQLLERVRWWEAYTAKHGFELNNNPSPGNKSGGLTTIMEKSLGAQAKGGTTALQAVYHYAEPVTQKGLVFMDSPGFDPVSVTGQVASGANVICFTTGRGSAFGFKPVPSIKLASNNEIYEKMREDIDVNCGGIISGEHSVSDCGQIIFENILRVASGHQTQSELLGYGNSEFNPWRLGATV